MFKNIYKRCRELLDQLYPLKIQRYYKGTPFNQVKLKIA